MYEALSKTIHEEIAPLSHGSLQCLPYSKALLEFFEARKLPASALVVRAIVYGSDDALEFISDDEVFQLFGLAYESLQANGEILTKADATRGAIKIYYRTLGMANGVPNRIAIEGGYGEDGRWMGHLVVIQEGTLVDLTIGQLNSDVFKIRFDPPYIATTVDAIFLAGKGPHVVHINGRIIVYWAFPKENTHEASKSWTDPDFSEQLKGVGRRVADIFKDLPDVALHDI